MSCSCCSSSHSKEAYEPFINPFHLAEYCHLDNHRTKFKNAMIGPDSDGWGESRLQSLPIELYQACLQHLDIATLTAMRRVSQFTRYTIDSLHQYKELYDHAPQALRACLATGVAPHIPLKQIHHSLINMECYYCKTFDPPKSSFGSYLSLYDCRRGCLFCLRNNPELRPVELMALMNLYLVRNCSISSIKNILQLRTIPGTYSPLKTFGMLRTTLIRGPSIQSLSGKSLTDKEKSTLHGKEHSAIIYHHPLVSPKNHSDIGPTRDYVPPDTDKQLAQRYMSAVMFPYLTSGKQVSDHGTTCRECNLHMQFEEQRWTAEQEARRRNFQDPTASVRTRDYINGVRRKACMQYTVSEEAMKDEIELFNKHAGEVEQEDGKSVGAGSMSFHQHKLLHVREKLSLAEANFREKLGIVRGPPGAGALTQ